MLRTKSEVYVQLSRTEVGKDRRKFKAEEPVCINVQWLKATWEVLSKGQKKGQ